MILYFSGSGNSKFVALYLERLLKDNVVSLKDIIKEKRSLNFVSDKPYVIVCPIYAWRYSSLIEDILKKSKLDGNKKIYFLATMGLNCGNADKYLRKIANSKSMEYMGFGKIVMPSNYVVSEKVESKEQIYQTISKAIPIIKNFANSILNNEKINYIKRDKLGFIYSSFFNYGFDHFYKGSKNLIVDDDCIKCKKCISVCPLNNISFIDDKIVISKNCMFCLSCVNNCPKNAITYKGRKNGTYICPELDSFLKN